MLRAAAKNHRDVCVLCNPDDYGEFIASLPDGPDQHERRRLATTAFAHTSTYDGQISRWLAAREEPDEPLPPRIHLALERQAGLRYGENPHQAAAVYRPAEAAVPGLAG